MKIIFDKTTPHMFMWITNGRKKLPNSIVDMYEDDQLLLPNVEGLEYLDRLKNECHKLQKTNTPVYLIYIGRTLKNGQKRAMEDLANHERLENLMVLDYDELEERIEDVEGERAELHILGKKQFYIEKKSTKVSKSRIVEAVAALVKRIDSRGSRGGLVPIIDSTRLLLLYNSALIKDLVKKKYVDNPYKTELLETCSQGLIYRDFDVSLIPEEMPDLEAAAGYISSLNSEVIFKEAYEKMLDANDGKADAINEFFAQELYDPKNFSKNLRLYDKLTKGVPLEQDEISKTKEELWIYFFENFSRGLAIENSFLGVTEDRSFVAANTICESFCPLNANSG